MDKLRGPDGQLPQKLRTLQPLHIEQISNEIMDTATNIGWDDIAGLHHVKECVTEMAIWPLLRAYGLIYSKVAVLQDEAFFYLVPREQWGDAEKLVRALFGVASCRQPAVIFFDEIDSLLSKRTSGGNENETSRRLKTQLLIEMEGYNNGTDQILVIEARAYIVRNLLKKDGLFNLSKKDIDRICKLTEGYSGSDMTNLVKDASMGPVREALRQGTKITKLKQEEMRPVSLQDFEKSLEEVRPSVSSNELATYEDWNNKFGTLSTSKLRENRRLIINLSRKRMPSKENPEFAEASDAFWLHNNNKDASQSLVPHFSSDPNRQANGQAGENPGFVSPKHSSPVVQDFIEIKDDDEPEKQKDIGDKTSKYPFNRISKTLFGSISRAYKSTDDSVSTSNSNKNDYAVPKSFASPTLPPVTPQSNGTSKGHGHKSYVHRITSNWGTTANVSSHSTLGSNGINNLQKSSDMLRGPDGQFPQKLRCLPSDLVERITNEIMNCDTNVRWDDIAGLHHAKKCVTEMVVWPLLRPDIFNGCRSPGRGLLLFGPPGTGKTMIGKAIAGEAKATFFHISASSLTSKWFGEGEKLVRSLFAVASCCQPAVIFVDEIDSLLSKRKSQEHEASRRLKTQFLIEMEGFDNANDQVLLIGATNRPQELDEAARRRLTKRFYIPLPSSVFQFYSTNMRKIIPLGGKDARAWIVRSLLEKDGLFKLSKEDIDNICKFTEGYSGSDMKNLVKDASMGPVREALIQGLEIPKLKKEDMRSVTLQDFVDSLQEMRPSVSSNELGEYEDWNNKFGSLSLPKTSVLSKHASGWSGDKVKDVSKREGLDSIDRHRKKLKTNALGGYTKLSSDAQTVINLDDDVYEIPPLIDFNTSKKAEKEKVTEEINSQNNNGEIMDVVKGIYESMQTKIRVKEIESLYKDTSNMPEEIKRIYLKRCQEIIEKYNL
ncbi:ATPase, AAA-type, core [Artemisia annua]|uniref:ATPase, AAA-type, core n=1 Tax=Artemisia annua TaxID=35608 RepID=A0A2U1M8P0_ARTAN|nr:ATPase, AAA-type, core [Artemisia annua]